MKAMNEYTSPILITGASGNIGKHVVSGLDTLGVAYRVASRGNLGHCNFRFLDMNKPYSYDDALKGSKSLFLLRPSAISNTKKTLNVLIDKAYANGVEHIVFVSVHGAENNSFVPHHAVERQLIQSGHSYTILRPGFFSQNLESAYRVDILEDSSLYLPSGDGKINFIDARDIAEVAIQALINPEQHSRKAYTLAGEEALTFYEVAKFLSEELGRPINYTEASVVGYFFHVIKQGHPVMKALVQTFLHTGIRSGQANILDLTASELLGRRTVPLRDYIHDNREKWIINEGRVD